MTKRLQVLLEDQELAEIQELARRRHQTTAAWVRDALRSAREATYPQAGRKLRAVREAAAHDYPVGEILTFDRGFDGIDGVVRYTG